MKILIATLRYLDLTGSETFTYTILKSLIRQNVEVSLYSPFLGGPLLKKTKKLQIPITDNLEDFHKYKFDVIHCQHNITSVLIRHYFPKTPLVYLVHGVKPFLEQSPGFIKFNYYGGISWEIYKKLKDEKISKKKLFTLPNSVDTQRFYPQSEISAKPKKMLVFGSRFNHDAKKIILAAASRCALSVSFLGTHNSVFDVENHINSVDIVLSLGRGIIEAMSCGRAALVFAYDGNLYKYGDGIVTEKNIDVLAKKNFSGRAKKIPFTCANLVKELQKYDKNMRIFNRQYVQSHFDMDKNSDILMSIYKKACREVAHEYDKDRVDFVAQSLNSVLELHKLSLHRYNVINLFSARLKDQLIKQKSRWVV